MSEQTEALRAAEKAGKRKSSDQSWIASLGASGFLLVVTGASLGIALLVLALADGNWVWLPIAVLVLVGSLAAIGYFLIDRTTELEKPSAEEVAALEAKGVRDPEGALNDELEPPQQEDVTPGAVDSKPVGPGS
jgi:hypothetical protein